MVGLFLTWTLFPKILSVDIFNRRERSRITQPAKTAFVKFSNCSASCFHFHTWNIHTKSLEYEMVLWGYDTDKFMSSAEKQLHGMERGRTLFRVVYRLVWSRPTSLSTPGFPQGGTRWYGVWVCCLTPRLLQPTEKPQMICSQQQKQNGTCRRAKTRTQANCVWWNANDLSSEPSFGKPKRLPSDRRRSHRGSTLWNLKLKPKLRPTKLPLGHDQTETGRACCPNTP